MKTHNSLYTAGHRTCLYRSKNDINITINFICLKLAVKNRCNTPRSQRAKSHWMDYALDGSNVRGCNFDFSLAKYFAKQYKLYADQVIQKFVFS